MSQLTIFPVPAAFLPSPTPLASFATSTFEKMADMISVSHRMEARLPRHKVFKAASALTSQTTSARVANT